MRHIHYHLREHEVGFMMFVLEFHYDCEILVVDRVGIHPVLEDQTLGPNIVVPDHPITNEVYHDVLSMLHNDGIV